MSATATAASLPWHELRLTGELHTDDALRRIYATDASAYQELPAAVAIPRTEADLVALIHFAQRHHIGLIPRTAGTSLAGQVVGSGIIVDVSKHFTQILEINPTEGWVRCQPGVIRNELNLALKPHGLLFGPETSTQNRAMLGGMLGNNSCGSNSIRYGSVREHILEVTALLADGSKATFGPLDPAAFAAKCDGPPTLERQLHRDIRDLLADPAARAEITAAFPHPDIPRRNTGYALDLLADASPLDPASPHPFHFGKLIAGSEGTLCLVTEIKLHCNPLPAPVEGLQCAHFPTLADALQATLHAVRHPTYAVELIDHHILDCTQRSLEHRHNRFFLQGEPGAILVTEFRGHTRDEVLAQAALLETDLRAAGLGYAYPVLFGPDTVKIWDLRKAGLGLLSNMPGDAKPVPVIEDTAVRVADLPAYIAEFNHRLHTRFGLDCVHYAHAGTGEIHLRPILDLKTHDGNRLFREVAQCIADLVKEYRGSLSGEHGDGRLRGEFLEQMIGPANYARIRAVKKSWDPHGIFNPRKIVDTPSMNTSLRFTPGHIPPVTPATLFDWSETQGMLGAAEMCNGSGDCRKTPLAGGTMCPSYMATRNESETTRARANLLRHALTTHPGPDRRSVFDHPDAKAVLDLCLSCKGCKKECPSTVDMAKLKAEFMQGYYDIHGVPLRSRLIAHFATSARLAALAPWVWNAIFGTPALRRLANRLVGFHPDRTIPLAQKPFRSRRAQTPPLQNSAPAARTVHLLIDEFTDHHDPALAQAAVEILTRLGYTVVIPDHVETGRSSLSKGLLRRARAFAAENVRRLAPVITAEAPLVGLEPSALLTFRDEYPDLLRGAEQTAARALAQNCHLLEDFLDREFTAGRITPAAFVPQNRTVHLHGHCQQKALGSLTPTVRLLEQLAGYTVRVIPSGCCGMAGSFGYEKEHYELSQQIGELVLFPKVRAAAASDLIAAPGTSCRHQIHDATARHAEHPLQLLHAALRT